MIGIKIQQFIKNKGVQKNIDKIPGNLIALTIG
jgi:hypothetical protein